jgi:membrane protease subunit HflC
LIAAVIVGGFVLYMSSFTVRFTEAAVVTTFGQAGARDVITEPGLRFKWPTPIQSTTVYDTRARFLQTKSETQQTADDRQIIVEGFMTWKVKDPLVFYQRFRGGRGSAAREHYSAAADVLTGNLRSAMSEVSRFRLGELFASEAGASKLGELERNILGRVNGTVDGYGVEVMAVGINSITLPQDTTREIFQRMSESRKRLAAKAESEGTALATAIRSEAEAAAKRIREFARFRADQIRNRGDVEAAPFLTALNEEPDLAVFLKQLEVMREGMGRRSTIVLPTNMNGLEMFTPEAREKAQRGIIPGSDSSASEPKGPRAGAAEGER